MNTQHLKNQLKTLALSMFRKEFFGIFHGSISSKTASNRFIINTKEAIFDALDDSRLIELYFQEDYRWNQASIDSKIHFSIYSQISDAKYVSFTVPPYITAYTLGHNTIVPKDHFGYKEFGSIKVFDPKSFEDWKERAQSEVAYYFQSNKTNIMVVKGVGVYAFNRDLHAMVKKLSILEKSCKILLLDDSKEKIYI